jgi:hypothetical protein
VGIKAKDPELDPNSAWKTILVQDILPLSSARGQRNRANLNPETDENVYRISFWQLVFPFEQESRIKIPSAFDLNELNRMVDSLSTFFHKKNDMCFEFLDRVTLSEAPDYRSYVCAEMWMGLINQRLLESYYRSQDQLWSDLDLIPHCSHTYNGEENELTEKA